MFPQSGRISDIYSPKPVFIAGNLILGIMSLGGGFVQNKIGLLILRAFSGIGAAFTISSALNLIVRLFPDPAEQSRAISWFGSAGAFGNVGGLLIGGVLAEFATWHWIFWLITLIAVPIALVSFIFIPTQPLTPASERPGLDLIGITTLTGSLSRTFHSRFVQQSPLSCSSMA
jgi:MFS family permease